MTNSAHRKGATILVAEDDQDNRDILRTLLAMRGFDVVEAADGQQAVELAASGRPDLILMDLKMPVMNGLAAARAIRQRPEPHLQTVPIVALSAYHPSQHGAVAFAAGCDDYVLKPIDYAQLEEVLERLPKRADAAGPLTDTLTACTSPPRDPAENSVRLTAASAPRYSTPHGDPSAGKGAAADAGRLQPFHSTDRGERI